MNFQETASYLGCLMLNEVKVKLLTDEAFIFSPLSCTDVCHLTVGKSMPQI